MSAEFEMDGVPPILKATNDEIKDRHGGRCAVHRHCLAQTVHHRIHGNRKDRRPENLLAVCGDGVYGGHGFIEANPDEAMRKGWTVTKFTDDPGRTPVWLADCITGPGWYRLDCWNGLTPCEEPRGGDARNA